MILRILRATISPIDTRRTRYSPIKYARTRRRERFGSERESSRSCHLGSDESQDQERHRHETEEEDDDEKADTFSAKRGGALPFVC